MKLSLTVWCGRSISENTDTKVKKSDILSMHSFLFLLSNNFVQGRICLFTVNVCHIATEILLNNIYNVKLLGLEALNEQNSHIPDKK